MFERNYYTSHMIVIICVWSWSLYNSEKIAMKKAGEWTSFRKTKHTNTRLLAKCN